MRIRVFASPDDAALYVATAMEQVLRYEPNPVFGLATGGSVVPLYHRLVSLTSNEERWLDATTINLDEYVGLASDHPQSYARFMEERLFSRIQKRPGRIFIPDGMAANLQEECSRYDIILHEHRIDLQLLGIGVNGHIGFNEPDSLLQSRTHVVELKEETIQSNARFFNSSDEVPRRAITMGMQSILQSKRIVLVAFGQEKARAIADTVSGTVRTEVPASVLQLHQDVTVVLDSASASLLEHDWQAQETMS